MIKIIEKSKTTVETVTPYYTLTYNYTIGGTSENVTREVYLSIDNPYIERYCILLNSLQPFKSRCGIIFLNRLRIFIICIFN